MKHLILFLALAITACAQVICPKCRFEGKTSIVTLGTSTTNAVYRPFEYDTKGNPIPQSHDDSTTFYSCSNNHTFTNFDLKLAKEGSGTVVMVPETRLLPPYELPFSIDPFVLPSAVKATPLYSEARESRIKLIHHYDLVLSGGGTTVFSISGLRQDDSREGYTIPPDKPDAVKAELRTADGRVWVARWEEKR